MRRTTSIDILRRDGPHGGMELVGRGRDLATAENGATVLDEAEVRATVSTDRHVLDVWADPDPGKLQGLERWRLSSGFRGHVREVLHGSDAAPLVRLLLDDLPVAALVSGYALQLAGVPRPSYPRGEHPLTDVCAGWASDATMLEVIAEEGRTPSPAGPPAPRLEANDPEGWHALPDLPPGGMRRRRRLDLWAGEFAELRVDAMFRDSHAAARGAETVLHEYEVRAEVDAETMVVAAARAIPRVLPWQECPWAVGSAGRIVGQPAGGLRDFVRDELVGTTTCTHLNDLLRSLADVPELSGRLP